MSTPIEFFKVYLSSLSSRRLMLPPAFTAQLNGEIPKKATIRDHSGKFWNVMLEMLERNLIMTDGWEDIARHHSLDDADFLIFKYNGGSHFDVELYGKNGLKKAQGQKIDNFNYPVKIETGIGAELPCNELVTHSKRKLSEMAVESTQLPGFSGGNQSKSSRGIIIQCREEVAEAVPGVKPLYTYFEITVKRTYRSKVWVPKNVVEACGIRNQKQLVICDENSRLWIVKASYINDGRLYLYSGWLDFCQANNVRDGDRCFFEYIIRGGEGGISNLMLVTITRKLRA